MHDPRRARGRRRDDDDGAAAVEFALVSILLFLLLFGIIEFGIGFFTQQGAAAGAREAARRAVVGKVTTCTNLTNIAKNAAGSASNFFNSVSLTTVDDNGAGNAPNGVVGDVGDDVKVTITYHVALPFVSALVPGVPSNLVNLTQTGTARIEGQGSVTSCP